MPTLPDPAVALEEAIGLAQRGELALAERLLRGLLEQEPTLARAHNVLGVVQLQQGKLEDAEASFRRAMEGMPRDARAHINLGKLYGMQRRAADAERHLREALRLDPSNVTAHFNFAAFLQGEGRAVEAEAAFRHVLELNPHDTDAWTGLGRLLLGAFRFMEAETCFREVIRLRPEFPDVRNDLAITLLETGRSQEAEESCREATRLEPGFLRAWSNYVMCGQYDPAMAGEELATRARQAGHAAQAIAARFDATPLASVATAPAELSLGFVSADLHHHPVGLFLLPLLRQLKLRRVRVTLYSDSRIVDEVSEELRNLAAWIDIAGQTDEQVWSRIRRDRPDVLVDLAGHTGNNRLAVFAGRAAAIQISWLGYFATTGTPNMDFVLMDPWHAPAGCENQFSEKIIRLPHTRFCYQPLAAAPDIAPHPPASDRGAITFGSFNSLAKINDDVIAVWSRILHAAPGSRLVLKWRTLGEAQVRVGLAARFRRAGISADRLDLRTASDHAAMLGQYAGVDVALDPFPFTGGQTSFEAFWMGVPVVTLPGLRPVSRQTLCILGNLGLQEFAAGDREDYVHKAVGLAQDASRLEEFRSSIRARMAGSPLMQGPQFAQAFLKALYDASSAL